ncbi:DUF6790 family protein [Methanobacterium sp. BAmetb5]|jgi:hypothetical protein|uniref:DUF6790 family protein n=1 Tax=Methanobacterium sp. BAmetb5 TaxID=2025351 RepID=UPI000E9DD823|nr:DUF6790 family protein [Methanobacterium sp. BAmetb5]AXV40069.1 MAG: hypothetical protein CIT02_06950 [Methanobacterium sp. BAmetb5]
MDTAYIWLVLGIIIALVMLGVQFYSKRVLTLKRIIGTTLLSLLVVTVGIGSIWASIGHSFFANQVASTIGWAPGSPFQQEVAFANLAFGVLGILCIWIRGNFWTATVIGVSIFLLGDAIGHISNIMVTGNYAAGNAGAVLVLDILIPLLLIGLLVAYKILEERAVRSAIKSLERSL